MTFFQILDSLLLQPLQLLFEVVYVNANRVIGNPGLSIIVLSLVMNFLVLPLYMRADALQEEERDMEARLHRGVTHIKKTFRGDEKMMILQTYYRQNHYKPTYVLRSAVSLFLEIPFFIAAYRFLSGLELIKGVPSTCRVFFITLSSLTSDVVWSSTAGCTGAAGRETAFLALWSCLVLCRSNRFNRSALLTTQKLDRLMAAAPNMGFRVRPKGMNTPAASGMPMVL